MTQRKNILRGESGFTLIEIIAVLVILGLLAVVAVPKYLDLQTDAAKKAADGVLAAAQSASSLSFAQGLLNPTGHTAITTGQHLLDAMDPAPSGWSANAATITDGTNTITITSGENLSANPPVPAKLSKSW